MKLLTMHNDGVDIWDAKDVRSLSPHYRSKGLRDNMFLRHILCTILWVLKNQIKARLPNISGFQYGQQQHNKANGGTVAKLNSQRLM